MHRINSSPLTLSSLIEYGIVKQKSLKIDIDLEKQEEATKELERDIQMFLTKLELLNKKISKARLQHDTKENECQLEHTELVLKLKLGLRYWNALAIPYPITRATFPTI
ncbi:uncharacterized protein LOC128864683 [Anastrepha ludens]|uniref:uncharacterized protein LOC128864683 n=1 Tax=Anastrepha ludens TaxID=28586 RepID=UPI0023B080E3|nr:uncharacterized protein LOC128864683 [Anastrepha ludens]